MTKLWLLAILLVMGCAERKPLPGVVQPNPGEILTSIPGPMPNFGPFDTVEEALLAACPLILSQPHAIIPVRPGDQNFKTYWRTADEYCAWFYAPDGKRIEMSYLTVSAVQDDPIKRQCRLPPYVTDVRYPADAIVYLILGHGHPVDLELNEFDLGALARMVRLHGLTASLNGHPVAISAVAFFGQEHDGRVTCSGYYQYVPLPSSEIVKVTIDTRSGQTTRNVIKHVRWDDDGDPVIVP